MLWRFSWNSSAKTTSYTADTYTSVYYGKFRVQIAKQLNGRVLHHREIPHTLPYYSFHTQLFGYICSRDVRTVPKKGVTRSKLGLREAHQPLLVSATQLHCDNQTKSFYTSLSSHSLRIERQLLLFQGDGKDCPLTGGKRFHLVQPPQLRTA